MAVDEIQTGMGRTGKWFAIDHWGLDPDILIMGKALGGGLPLGAILARAHIADAWDPGAHGSTFGGNPVCCAAGLAAIDVIDSEGLIDRARQTGAFIKQAFESARASMPQIGEVRGMGLMISVDIVDPRTQRPAVDRVRDLLRSAAEAGVVLSRCGVASIRIVPPLIITREQAAAGVNVVLGVLREAGATAPA
jgi:4-aminobutyrate aminotransferase